MLPKLAALPTGKICVKGADTVTVTYVAIPVAHIVLQSTAGPVEVPVEGGQAQEIAIEVVTPGKLDASAFITFTAELLESLGTTAA